MQALGGFLNYYPKVKDIDDCIIHKKKGKKKKRKKKKLLIIGLYLKGTNGP